MGTDDFIQFYHRRMNLIWDYTQTITSRKYLRPIT